MKAELVKYDLYKDFTDGDFILNVNLDYTDKSLHFFFRESNFRNPSILRYYYSTKLLSVEDLESALSFTFDNYPRHSSLAWRAVNWLMELCTEENIEEEDERYIIARIPNFLEDTRLEAYIDSASDAPTHYVVTSEDSSRFVTIDSYPDGGTEVNDFDVWSPPRHALPFREEEHNKILAHFNASFTDINLAISNCINNRDLADWLAEVVPPTSGGLSK